MTDAAPSLPVARSAKWVLRCTIVSILLIGAALFEARIAIGSVPFFEDIFQVMIGPHEKYPDMTRLAMASARFFQETVFIIALALLLMLAVLWWRRGAIWIVVTCTIAVLVLAGVAVGTHTAMTLTYAQVRAEFPGNEEEWNLFVRDATDRTPIR
jgi:hypothetical protein